MTTRLVGLALAAMALAGPTAAQEDVSACLITRTETNPFFVKMREGAEAKAQELGVTLSAYAGKEDGDHETQVQAIETCIANGVRGILLAAAEPSAIASSVQQARDAGILVIALDSPLNPIEAADGTISADNYRAGHLVGEWARAQLGDAASDAKVGILSLAPEQPTVDVLRVQGFLDGFGIDTKDADVIGDETDPRLIGIEPSYANEEGGRDAMEALLGRSQEFDVIFAINDNAAVGAYSALRARDMGQDTLIGSVDGTCFGVQNVNDDISDATAQIYPLDMGALGIGAIVQYARDGTLPQPTEGKDFLDAGVQLVTNKPVAGVESIDTAQGAELCWG